MKPAQAPLALLGMWPACVLAATLQVVAEPYPPYLTEQGGKLSGPFADAFTLLMNRQGIDIRLQNMPLKRGMGLVATQADTCALAVNFAPGEAETVSYVGRAAPITLTVYQRKTTRLAGKNIENLRKLRVGAINIAEVRDLLGSAGIRYEAVDRPAQGFPMLKAGRFDVFISDQQPDSKEDSVGRGFILAELERWVVCNSALAPVTAAAIRRALHEGLFAAETRSIWKRYALENYFLDTRKRWLLTRTP